MKTSELEGALLDYWVARAQGNEARINVNETEILLTEGHRGIGPQWYIFEPSTNWDRGGPIIEREKISVAHNADDWSAALGDGSFFMFRNGDEDATGPTPLIAAMRAYVASKFGDTVPDKVSQGA